MFNVLISILGAAVIIAVYEKSRARFYARKIAKADYETALNEMQSMQEFLENSDRVNRWKAIQFKCQFFANAYKNDKASEAPEISGRADEELEIWISGRLDEVFAIKDDTYCRSASFDAIAQLLAEVGQFDRAKKVIDLIEVTTIKNNALQKYKELEVRYSGA